MKSPPSYQESIQKKDRDMQRDYCELSSMSNGKTINGNGSIKNNSNRYFTTNNIFTNDANETNFIAKPLDQRQQSYSLSPSSELRKRLAKSPTNPLIMSPSNTKISISKDLIDGNINNYNELNSATSNKYLFDRSNGAAPTGSTAHTNRFTNEIERELANLTLSIEKEMEKQPSRYTNSSRLSEFDESLNELAKQGNGRMYGKCFKCHREVNDRAEACLAMGNIYHTDCFVCASCGRTLRGKSFYNINNQNYCEEDYLYSGFLENAEKCNKCGHIIVDMILQACGKSYHPGCFRCITCNQCLDGRPFTLDINNDIYCIQDYYKKYAPKCYGCRQLITPNEGSNETVRVVAMEKDFHIECYACQDCGAQLTDETEKRCYPIDDRLLCLRCHLAHMSNQQAVMLNSTNEYLRELNGFQNTNGSINNGHTSYMNTNGSTSSSSSSSATVPLPMSSTSASNPYGYHQAPNLPNYYQPKQMTNGYY